MIDDEPHHTDLPHRVNCRCTPRYIAAYEQWHCGKRLKKELAEHYGVSSTLVSLWIRKVEICKHRAWKERFGYADPTVARYLSECARKIEKAAA